MKPTFLIFILLLLSASSFGQSKDESQLKSLIKEVTNAQQEFDPDQLNKLLTVDYIEISPLGEFDPKEKVIGFYKPELKPPADKFSGTSEIDEYSIRIYGKFAIVIARVSYTLTSEGKTLPPRSIRATYFCRKINKEWKVASAQYTGIRPANAASKQD